METGFTTLTVEVSKGQFRLWATFDSIDGKEETRYPEVYQYSVNGSTIKLLLPTDLHMDDEWTFRKLNGKTTLWSKAAINSWRYGHTLGQVLERRGIDPDKSWADYINSIRRE